MPLYEYECQSCGARFEVIQKFSDAPVENCRSCSGKVQRLLSAPAIQFKGTGWYVTDYAHKGSGASETGRHAASSSTAGTTTDKPSSGAESASSASAPPPPASSSGGDKS